MRKSPDDLQVCFVTTTQYQFLIADVYARYIFDNFGIRSKVLVRYFKSFDISRFDTEKKYELISYTINNRNVLGQCVFALQCGYLYKMSSWSKLLDKDKRTILFVFNDLSKLTSRMIQEVKKNDINNKVVLVEEGNNTYSDALNSGNEKVWKLKHKMSKIMFGNGRTSRVIGDDPGIDIAIVKDPVRYGSLKKAQKQKILQQNTDILFCASDFISHYNQACSIDLDCDVLFLGQPFYKNGTYYEEENRCISEMFDAIPGNVRILIKPHPRDSEGKYDRLAEIYPNVSVVNDELSVLPIETLLGIADIKIVMTIESSAATTLANLSSDIGTIVLRFLPQAEKLRQKLVKDGAELPDIRDDFFVGKYDNIYLPKTTNEYKKLIDSLLVKEHRRFKFPEVKNILFSEIDCLVSE